MSLDIGAKERMLQMKKIEIELSRVTDAVKKVELEKKLKTLKTETDEYMKKVEESYRRR